TTTRIMSKTTTARFVAGLLGCWLGAAAPAQEVCLPAPRLLTIMPMGGRAATTVEVTITGENIDRAAGPVFSPPRLPATPNAPRPGQVETRTFVVTIAPDAPQGVHDARVLSRLGVSSSRAFSVSGLPEVTRSRPNRSPETALELQPNSICNAVMTPRGV